MEKATGEKLRGGEGIDTLRPGGEERNGSSRGGSRVPRKTFIVQGGKKGGGRNRKVRKSGNSTVEAVKWGSREGQDMVLYFPGMRTGGGANTCVGERRKLGF